MLFTTPCTSPELHKLLMTKKTTPYHRHHKQQLLSSLVILLFLSVIVTSSEAQTGPNVPVSNPYQQYSHFTPSLAIIIVILVAALFLMGFFSVYIRHCSNTTNSRSGMIAVAGRSRRGPRGLDKEAIESFPTFAYSDVKHLKIGKGALECAVCLNEFEEEEKLRLLPKCDHVFHPECIDAWLSSHTTCPVCRANLAEGTVATEEVNSNLAAEPESDSDESSTTRGRDAELGGADAVSIRVTGENENDESGAQAQQLNPTQLRSRSITSIIFSKFSRSHSTGHSLVQPGENVERFTLKLPDDIRKQIMSRKLNRTTSLVVFPGEASSRRGYRTAEPIDGSSRGKHIKQLGSLDRVNNSDRWIFSKAPPFFARESSFNNKSPRINPGNDEGSSKRFGMFGRISFNRLGSRRDNPGSMADDSNRPPI